MPRGFWTGLSHGAGFGVVALAGLSLLTPLPRQADEAAPPPDAALTDAPPAGDEGETAGETPADGGAGTEGGAEAVTEAGAGTEATAEEPAETAETGAGVVAMPPVPRRDSEGREGREGDSPHTAELGLPVGSEFGRGGDMTPTLPEPLLAPSTGVKQTEAPVAPAPAAETAPDAETDPDLRPEATAPGALLMPPQDDMADADLLPTSDPPAGFAPPPVVELPRMAGVGEPDSLPRSQPAEAIALPPAPENPVAETNATPPAEVLQPPISPQPPAVVQAETDVQPVDKAAPEAAPGDDPGTDTDTAAPARISAPAPDLSLPPALSDLGRSPDN